MSDTAGTIGFEDFLKVVIRIGTVVEAALNPKARVPAYVLRVDFGELGTKTSSAQITDNYQPADLLGKQVVAVVNFEPKRIAGVKSEVLILGAVNEAEAVVLLEPGLTVKSGSRIG